MTVPLFPPYTTGLGRPDGDPIAEAPEFVRTRAMSRWHRPRSGVAYADGRRAWHVWCGQIIHGTRRQSAYLAVDVRPADGLPVCGTCDGRAAGAGQIPGPNGRRLAFAPRWQDPPRWCPGSRSDRLYVALPGGTTGQCLACHDTHPLRAMGGPYNGRTAIVQHPPGPGLLPPCPWHAWRQYTATDGRPHCTCGQQLT